VLDIQYRLPPEHPFPAALNDVEDAIKYVVSHPELYDTSSISLSGFSAGGNLALAVLSSTVIPSNTVNSVLAFYPPVDLSIEPGEKVQADPSGPNAIPAAGARLFNACYTEKENRTDPLVSPAFMDISRLPKKALLVTCAYDTLALETERLAERVQKEGQGKTDVVCERIDGVSHAWDKSCKAGSEGEKKREEAYALAVKLLNK
jgi:acetyl esterase/lipase